MCSGGSRSRSGSSTPRCTASLRLASVIMPSRLSSFSRAIRKRAWPLAFACCHSDSIGSSMSSQMTSWRGIMIEPTLRSASASTPSTRRRSEARNTPARVPSATQRAYVVFGHRRLRAPRRRGRIFRNALTDDAQQPDQRRHERGEQSHDRCDAHRERFGVQQRDALGHQLADDERDEGDDQHDDAVGDLLGVPGRHAVAGQRAGQRRRRRSRRCRGR